MSQENGSSLLGLLNQVDVKEVLNESAKYEGVIEKITSLVDQLNKSGVLPTIVKVIDRRLETSQPKPIVEQVMNDPLMIRSKTPVHYVLFKELNKLSEDEITNLIQGLKGGENEERTKHTEDKKN